MRLIDVCDINPRAQAIDDNLEVSFVAMPDVSEDGKINTGNIRSYCEVKKGFTCFQEGDVLFAKITPCMENGKGALAVGLKNGIGCGSTEFHVLRPNTEVLQGQWLYYLTSWSAFRKDAERHMTGSAGQKRVPKAYLEKYELQIPTLSEQLYQVKSLDRVKAVIELRKRELQSLDDLIKARFVEMFGDPMLNNMNFELRKYGGLFELNAGGTPSKAKTEYWDGGTISWIGSNMCQNTYIYENDGNYITEDGMAHSSARMFPTDTVLVALVGATIGKTALLKFETTTNQNVLGIRKIRENGYLPEFVFYYTQGLYQKFLNIGDGGFAMASKGLISELPIPVVDIQLQKEFATFVAQVDKSKAVVQKALDKAQLLFDSLMQKYFG